MTRILKALGIALLILLAILIGPILYTEAACRGKSTPQQDPLFITDPADHRPEARTYLTYPEWHIVYVYEGYAQTLKAGKPHNFPYIKSIAGFWTSLCALTKKADELGKAGWDSKATIYTIGTSFTLEMIAKLAYETTIGRLTSWQDSPQDQLEAQMAETYAIFLQQTPWYKFDFIGWTEKLLAAPTSNIRAYERRIALGLEWQTKAAYARMVASAVAGIGADELTMKIAIRNVDLSTLPKVTLVQVKGDTLILDVPRYRDFTNLVEAISQQNGEVLEVAGNDDILVSIILDGGDFYPSEGHRFGARMSRVGFASDRILLGLKTNQLQSVFTDYPNTPIRVEHIYDY